MEEAADRQLIQVDKQLQELDEQLDELLLMHEHYVFAADHYPLLSNADIVPGTACVAQYSVDKCWYRGEVICVESTSHSGILAGIRFVDYGSWESVPPSKLRVIPTSDLVLPMQSRRCVLNGITCPTNPELVIDDTKKMKKIFFNLQLVAVVKSVNSNDIFIDIFDKTEFATKGLGASTIYSKLIRKRDRLKSSDQEDGSDNDFIATSSLDESGSEEDDDDNNVHCQQSDEMLSDED